MRFFLLTILFLASRCSVVTISGCHSDRDKDHRPRVSCVGMGLTSVPAGIEPSTEVLVFTQNQFSSLSWAAYTGFPELHELDLSQNQITALDPPGPVLAKLSVLRLSGNRLVELGEGVFRSAPALMEVYLQGNGLRLLHEGSFSDLPVLEVLDLQQNQISVLPLRLLERISSAVLKTLDLEQNRLSLMPNGWFNSKPELPYVYLSKNPWVCSCQVGYLQVWLEDQGHNVYLHNGPSTIVNNPESVVCASPAHLDGSAIIDLTEDVYCSATEATTAPPTTAPPCDKN